MADISCGAQTGPMLLWHHLEVQMHHTPQREAGLHSHPMPHCYRSAQVTGAGVATEHVLSTGTRAKRYYRRCIATEADATFRPHCRSCHNPRRTQGNHKHAHRRCSPGGRKQADRQHCGPMLCSSGIQDTGVPQCCGMKTHNIFPRKDGSLAARASAYCLRVLFVSKSSRNCCSVADISWKILFLLSLSATKRWPWTMASRACVFLSSLLLPQHLIKAC